MNKLISINPANENIINQYIQHTEEEVEEIIVKSSIAQLKWKDKNINERIKVNSEIRDDLSINLNT